jgi:hypothetical protein
MELIAAQAISHCRLLAPIDHATEVDRLFDEPNAAATTTVLTGAESRLRELGASWAQPSRMASLCLLAQRGNNQCS